MRNVLLGSRVFASSSRTAARTLVTDSTDSSWPTSASPSHLLRFDLPADVAVGSQLKTLRLTFQGGYSAKEVTLLALPDTDNAASDEEDDEDEGEDEDWTHTGEVELLEGGTQLLAVSPLDSNAKQSFDIPPEHSKLSTRRLAIQFRGSSDSWGRVTLYGVELLVAESR